MLPDELRCRIRRDRKDPAKGKNRSGKNKIFCRGGIPRSHRSEQPGRGILAQEGNVHKGRRILRSGFQEGFHAKHREIEAEDSTCIPRVKKRLKNQYAILVSRFLYKFHGIRGAGQPGRTCFLQRSQTHRLGSQIVTQGTLVPGQRGDP